MNIKNYTSLIHHFYFIVNNLMDIIDNNSILTIKPSTYEKVILYTYQSNVPYDENLYDTLYEMCINTNITESSKLDILTKNLINFSKHWNQCITNYINTFYSVLFNNSLYIIDIQNCVYITIHKIFSYHGILNLNFAIKVNL